jgi:hypothetical protein
MKSPVIPTLVALLGLSAAPALAADVFTVNVPYKFAALDPSITSVGISCQVRGYEPVTNKFMTFAPVKNTSVPVVKGAASGQRNAAGAGAQGRHHAEHLQHWDVSQIAASRLSTLFVR